ncbi:MAG: chemotaxis protein CheW, partial [Microcystaceae cyanobacterium]
MTMDFFRVELESAFSLAIPLERTAEVLSIQWSELCPIPGINIAFLGVSNQRGRLMWMVDIAALLGLTVMTVNQTRLEKSTAIVLMRQELRIAAVVSRLQGIATFEEHQLQPHSHPG